LKRSAIPDALAEPCRFCDSEEQHTAEVQRRQDSVLQQILPELLHVSGDLHSPVRTPCGYEVHFLQLKACVDRALQTSSSSDWYTLNVLM
jgi:hypothetical protein